MRRLYEGLLFFWYLFQKPLLILLIIVICYLNTSRLIILFKNTADWIAKQAGVAVTDHVIVVESRKPPKVILPKGVKPRPDEGFMWPVTGPVSSPFGPRWGGEFHHGIDIAVPSGTKVACAKDGYVIKTGWSDIYGNFVQVDHGDGISTLYGHNSLLYAKEGEMVKQGDIVSLSGSTGRSTGPHVHFEIRAKNKAINPLAMSFDGLDRKQFAKQLAEATKKQAAQMDGPEEIKRKYIVTIEKSKTQKINQLKDSLKTLLISFDYTINYQYRCLYGLTADTTKYASSVVTIQNALSSSISISLEILPILATQIQISNDPNALVVKEANFSVKT